jgi:hypothetical protein
MNLEQRKIVCSVLSGLGLACIAFGFLQRAKNTASPASGLLIGFLLISAGQFVWAGRERS